MANEFNIKNGFIATSDSRVIGNFYVDTISAATYLNSSSTAFTGGTVSGATSFTGGLSAITISATTYLNLPSSTFTGGTVTGTTNFTNGLTANTISATTYQNLPIDIRVTGGTYSSGTIIFTNNTGGTFSVTGFSSGGSSQVKLSSQTLTASSWTLVGSYYEYTFSNANIVSTGFVNFTPNNASINEVSTCRMLPQIDSNSGTCKFYSLFPPQTNIVGEIVIFIL